LNKPSLLAVGDKDSCIHLLSLPKSFWKENKDEVLLMTDFIEKEKQKNNFYSQKYE